MKARIRYDSIEIDAEGTSSEVADLVTRLKQDRGLKGISTTVRTTATDAAVPSKEALLDYLRKQPKARHSVRGLTQDLMGRQVPTRLGRKSNPEYLKLLARLQAARADLEAERKARFKQGKDGKEVFYSLE